MMLQRILVISALLFLAVTPALAGYKEARNAFLDKEWDQAITLLRPMVAAGDGRAMVLLGHMYARGLGVGQSPKEALSLYKRAALEKNDTDAMVELGFIASDQNLGKEWFYRAARLGNGTGAYLYGAIISKEDKKSGNAPKADFYNAYKWFKISAAANPEHSKYRGIAENMATLIVQQSKLNAADLARANKEVAAWKPVAATTLGPPPAIPQIAEPKPAAQEKP